MFMGRLNLLQWQWTPQVNVFSLDLEMATLRSLKCYQADGQTNRQTDRQTGRQIDRQTD
jgi:hypothetical protein